MTTQRPVINGVRRPLSLDDPLEWWTEEASRLGLSVEELRAQVRLADEIIDELVEEDQKEAMLVWRAWGKKNLSDWKDVEDIHKELGRGERVTTQRPVPEPIDVWLLGDPTPGSPWRSVTLGADRSETPRAVLACLTEGSEERGLGRGATTAEALANALNDLMGRQGT